MATVAAVIASTHHPFYYRASTAAGADRPPFADEWVAKIEAFRCRSRNGSLSCKAICEPVTAIRSTYSTRWRPMTSHRLTSLPAEGVT
jgi:hypothetical protein